MRTFLLSLFLAIPFPSPGEENTAPGQSIAQLISQAQNNNPQAAFQLAESYLTGKNVDASIPKALEWYQIAADLNHLPAHLRLGEIYLKGAPGITPEEDRGLFHLRHAAEAGIPEASGILGQLSLTKATRADAKPDRERHFEEAREHFELACKKNHAPSQLALAFLLEAGQGGGIDLPRALSLIKKSAQSGHAEAMNELGLRHQKGATVPRDPVTALGWFFAGAERENPGAMTNLGTCYAKGIVLPNDPNKAGSWYAKAAKLNYAPAQYLLGEIFEKGPGIPPNPVFAFVNYTRAANANHAKARKALESLEPTLTPKQKDQALELLRGNP